MLLSIPQNTTQLLFGVLDLQNPAIPGLQVSLISPYPDLALGQVSERHLVSAQGLQSLPL